MSKEAEEGWREEPQKKTQLYKWPGDHGCGSRGKKQGGKTEVRQQKKKSPGKKTTTSTRNTAIKALQLHQKGSEGLKEY